jgi:hypothetical protein
VHHFYASDTSNTLFVDYRSAIIFEDNIDLEWDFEIQLRKFWPALPSDWDIVYIGTTLSDLVFAVAYGLQATALVTNTTLNLSRTLTDSAKPYTPSAPLPTLSHFGEQLKSIVTSVPRTMHTPDLSIKL